MTEWGKGLAAVLAFCILAALVLALYNLVYLPLKAAEDSAWPSLVLILAWGLRLLVVAAILLGLFLMVNFARRRMRQPGGRP